MKRILIVNPFGIGDVIFSMVFVEALRARCPEAVIGFLCNERTVGLVRVNAAIDQTFVFNRDLMRRLWKRHPLLFFRKLRALLGLLKEARFDTMFDFSLGREYGFFAMWIGIKRRIGFDFKGRGIFLTDKKKLDGYDGRPVAEIQLELLDRLGWPVTDPVCGISLHVSERARQDAKAFLRKNGIEDQDGLLCVAPGGGRSWGPNAVYKQWDPDRFAEVADVVRSGRGWKLILLGDKSEEKLLEKTARLIKISVLVCCGESFERLCGILLRSKALLCNDGGLLHLANALGVKTVSLFGPVDETVYGPYFRNAPHRVLTEPVPCRPCYKEFHFPPCQFDRRCLTELHVNKAIEAIQKIT